MLGLNFTLAKSQTYSDVKPGMYHCLFVSLTPLETSKGKALRWEFKDEKSGIIISDLSDANTGPNDRNKTGRWLCALSSKPLEAETNIVPLDYVGKRYMVIVEAKAEGKTKISTFTAI